MRRTLLLVLSFLVIVPYSSFAITTSSNSTEEAPVAITSIKDAMKQFKALSRKEKKERIKEVKKEIKSFKAEKKAGKEPSTNTVLLAILAILLPPLAVYLHEGETNNRFWLSVLLTILFWVPGVIYALIVVLGD